MPGPYTKNDVASRMVGPDSENGKYDVVPYILLLRPNTELPVSASGSISVSCWLMRIFNDDGGEAPAGVRILIFPLSINFPSSLKSYVTLIGLTWLAATGSPSWTPAGTVLMARLISSTHVSRKPVPWADSACIVAFLSLSYNRRSEFIVSLYEVTNGPPLFPVPFRYSPRTLGSNTPRVVSKLLPPFVFSGVTKLSSTTSGKPPYRGQQLKASPSALCIRTW